MIFEVSVLVTKKLISNISVSVSDKTLPLLVMMMMIKSCRPRPPPPPPPFPFTILQRHKTSKLKLSRLSGNFLDCLGNFHPDQKFSRPSRNCPNYPETALSIRKRSKLFGNFPNCPKTFQTVLKLSKLS